jgi:hypothetical protein
MCHPRGRARRTRPRSNMVCSMKFTASLVLIQNALASLHHVARVVSADLPLANP